MKITIHRGTDQIGGCVTEYEYGGCLYGANIDGLDNNVHYLCNSGVEIDGVKFYS